VTVPNEEGIMPIDEEGPRRYSIPPGCTLDLEQCRALEQRGLDPAVIERHYKLGEDARRALEMLETCSHRSETWTPAMEELAYWAWSRHPWLFLEEKGGRDRYLLMFTVAGCLAARRKPGGGHADR
jgi:hypothetical protein